MSQILSRLESSSTRGAIVHRVVVPFDALLIEACRSVDQDDLDELNPRGGYPALIPRVYNPPEHLSEPQLGELTRLVPAHRDWRRRRQVADERALAYGRAERRGRHAVDARE